jgi:hypothetical protein
MRNAVLAALLLFSFAAHAQLESDPAYGLSSDGEVPRYELRPRKQVGSWWSGVASARRTLATSAPFYCTPLARPSAA